MELLSLIPEARVGPAKFSRFFTYRPVVKVDFVLLNTVAIADFVLLNTVIKGDFVLLNTVVKAD